MLVISGFHLWWSIDNEVSCSLRPFFIFKIISYLFWQSIAFKITFFGSYWCYFRMSPVSRYPICMSKRLAVLLKDLSCSQAGRLGRPHSIFFSRQIFCSVVSPSNQATFMAAHISIPADLISFRWMKKEKQRKTQCQRRKAQEPKQKDISSGQKAFSKCTVTFECFVAKDLCSRIFLELIRFSYGKMIFKN